MRRHSAHLSPVWRMERVDVLGKNCPRILYHLVAMERWSGTQRAFAVKNYYKNNDSFEAARRGFRRNFNLGHHDPIPSAHAMKLWVKIESYPIEVTPPGLLDRPIYHYVTSSCGDI